MPHISLDRRYRPQTFAEVVGQDHVTATLARAVDEGQPHHAYLFTGPRGTGKTSTARILAKSLNCEHGPTSTPDGTCGQCVAITEGSSVDVIEIDAASHGGVDDVRDLRDRVAFAPASARTKVYIVDECHMLSTAGWNAFLKTVEEPPGHVVFVFATTEPHKVLPTILSRTQRFDFRRVPAAELHGLCLAIAAKEGIVLGPGALEVIVAAGDGSARDTLSVLEQVVAFTGPEVTLEEVADVLGSIDEQLLAEMSGAIADGDAAALCVLVGRLTDQGVDPRQFAKDAVAHLRDLFLLSTAPEAGLVEATPERLESLAAQAGRLGRSQLLRAIELLADAQALMRRGNTRLPLELALVKAALPEHAGDPAALAARMDRLERRAAAPAAVGPAAAEPATAEPAPAAPAAVGPVAAAPAPPPSPEPPPTGQPRPDASDGEAHVAGGHSTAAPESAHALDLGDVQRAWDAVLETVKQRKRRLHAFLDLGRPVGLDGKVLTLEYGERYGFHAEQVAQPDWTSLFAEVFSTLLGEPLVVRAIVGSDGSSGAESGEGAGPGEDVGEAELRRQARAVAEVEAAASAGELPSDEEAFDAAVRVVRDELGATPVEGDE